MARAFMPMTPPGRETEIEVFHLFLGIHIQSVPRIVRSRNAMGNQMRAAQHFGNRWGKLKVRGCI